MAAPGGPTLPPVRRSVTSGPFRTWRDVRAHELFPGVHMRAIGGEQVLLCQVTYEPGCALPGPTPPLDYRWVRTGPGGEPGIQVMKMATSDEMADLMLDTILPDLPFEAGAEVAVLISGLGATPIGELYILYSRIAEVLAAKGIQVRFNFVGNYFTSLEMMGVTLTLMKLDDELKACLAHPCRAIGLTVTAD